MSTRSFNSVTQSCRHFNKEAEVYCIAICVGFARKVHRTKYGDLSCEDRRASDLDGDQQTRVGVAFIPAHLSGYQSDIHLTINHQEAEHVGQHLHFRPGGSARYICLPMGFPDARCGFIYALARSEQPSGLSKLSK